MLATSLINGVIKRGGTAELRDRGTNGAGDSLGFEVVGELNGYDVHMYTQPDWQTGKLGNSYYTVRRIAQRGQYDLGADYNPGGWTFLNTVKSLDWATR